MRTNQKWACYRAAPPALQIGLLGIIVILLGLIVFLSACTSLYPMEGDAKTVQEQIRDGQALQQGDHVRVVTKDGVSRILTVASVEGDVLKGNLDSNKPALPWREDQVIKPQPEQEKGEFVEIPIVDIVLIEKEKVSTGKTAAAIGGGAIVILALPILALLLAYAL
jgi:hypothetical protein